MRLIALSTSALLSIPKSVRVSVLKRVSARFIDSILMLFVSAVLPYPVGPLAGLAYSVLGDALNIGPFRHQSVGKKLLGLQVRRAIPEAGGSRPELTLKEIALRNLPVGIVTFLQIIPVVGWILFFLVGIPLLAVEVWLMIHNPGGHRLGDVLGDTEVGPVELSTPALPPAN